MFKTVVFLALIAFVCAGELLAPGAVVYTSPSEHPIASGYEYEHSVQTPDYATYSSVSAPLNGFAALPPLLRSIYTSPVAYAHPW